MADAKKMWEKVVTLAPNSSEAKTVATHLKGLASEGAKGSPTSASRSPSSRGSSPSRRPACCRSSPATSATWSPSTPTARRRRAAPRSSMRSPSWSASRSSSSPIWGSVGLVGYLFRDYIGLLRELGGAILVFMGLHVAGVISISALYRERRLPMAAVADASNGSASVGLAAPPARPGAAARHSRLRALGPARRRLRGRLDALHRPDPRRDHRPRLGQRERRPGRRPAARLRARPRHPLRPRRGRRHRGQRAARLAAPAQQARSA